jgi:DNA (cytosine-5)-methyltransferase 1
MTHGSLFSGIGGFDLASEWMGWENIFHCEWNEFGQRVLKHHFPKSISYGDITTTDFTIHRGQIDILTGGFPCQPYSQAGKRLGKEDDRHLWPEMLRAIREIQPRWVVGENVLGLVNWNGGLVFDEVQADLENEGYVVQPYVLPACAVNAPHRRDRVWFVAHTESNGGSRASRSASSEIGRQDGRQAEQPIKRGKVRNATNAKNVGCKDTQPEHGERNDDSKWTSCKHEEGRNDIWPSSIGHGESGATTDTDHARTINAMRDNGNGAENDKGRQGKPQPESWTACGDATNPNRNGQHGSNGKHEIEPSQRGIDAQRDVEQVCGDDTDTDSAGLQKTRPKQQATRIKQYGKLHGGAIGWENFPTQSPVCGGNDGLPTELDGITFSKWRQESVKAYGNAIVPQVAYQIFKAIEQYECQAYPNP